MSRRDPDSARVPLAQACVIPFRRQSDGWEYCLITSLKKKRWIFPKGIVDPGETPRESGLKEAWEEAGLRGEIVGAAVGAFRYEKWGQLLHAEVFLMRVTAEEDDWPERAQRERVWLGGRTAADRLERTELREIFQRVREQLFHARACTTDSTTDFQSVSPESSGKGRPSTRA